MRRFIAAFFAFALLSAPAMATPPVFNGNVKTLTTPVFNVLAYGADPTNTVSSATAIQNALSACGTANGGTVLVPNGTYMIDANLNVPNNCALVGSGLQNTILQAKTGSSIGGIIYQGSSSNITIQGITFDINNVASASGVQFYNSVNSRLVIRDCDFKNANGIWAVVIGGVTSGVYTNTTTDSQFTGNIVENNSTGTYEAAIFPSWQNGIISNNRFNNNTGSNAFASAVYGYSNHVQVVNNFFNSPSDTGDIYVQQGENVTFHGNHHISGASSGGVLRVVNSSNVTIDDDFFDMSASSSVAGIQVVDFSGTYDGATSRFPNTQYLTIQGNTFIGGYTGIDLPFDSSAGHNVAQQHVFIQGNNSSGSTQANLLVLSGTNATGINDIQVTGNYIAPGTWTANGAINLLAGSSNVTNVTIAHNIVRFSAGSGARGILISGAFPSVNVFGNDLSAWGTSGLFATGGPTIVDGGNLSSGGFLSTAFAVGQGNILCTDANQNLTTTCGTYAIVPNNLKFNLSGAAINFTTGNAIVESTSGSGFLWLVSKSPSSGVVVDNEGTSPTKIASFQTAGSTVASVDNLGAFHGAHNACSSSSQSPCETTVTCSLSAATTCSATATVPATSICSASGNASDTTTGVESFNLSLTTNTLTVKATVSASQTSTVAANVTCL